MKTILITGGAGYAGFTVTEMLAQHYPDSRILVYDRNQKGCIELVSLLKNKFQNVDFVLPEKSDIRDVMHIQGVLAEYKPEAIVHLAAKVTDFAKNKVGKDEECTSTNYVATANLARLAKDAGVKTFIHQSTIGIYEPGGDLKEDAPMNPVSAYMKSKFLGEESVLQFNDEKFNVIVLRPATIAGYNLHFKYENIFNIVCVRSVFKVPFTLFESALENPKTFLDVRDNARAVVFAIEHAEQMKGQAYNVTSFNATLNQILTLIKKELGEEFAYTILPEQTKNRQVYTINSDKIKTLGFKPEGKIEEIVKETIIKLKKVRELYSSLF
ncbi:NAD(P)-dependent oxidoreductase [Candidatus Pacearchaeota archaeon]|nr:NAD(P)-dependent oxidoreductase [Candidatus Pacearchaeota archaeon]